MILIKSGDLIALFQRMFKERWKYEWGKAETGCVDCSGAFVWAYQRFRKTIAHGSNSIARKHCGDLLPISAAVPGMAAFKYRAPGDKHYDLPKKFQPGGSDYNGDLNDYYHVGTVDADGKHVLNAQSSSAGFTRTKLSTWGKVAYLNAVEYDSKDRKENQPMQSMIITCPPGETVRLREQPDKKAETLCKIPNGTLVQGRDYDTIWSRIEWNGKSGFMLNEFLTPVSESIPEPQPLPDVIAQPVATATDLPAPAASVTYNDVIISLPLDVAAKLLEALTKVLGVG